MESIIEAWNKQADEYNHWDNLGCDEMNEFIIQYIQNKLSCFNEIVDDWNNGTPVVKLCYALNNEHMKAIKEVFEIKGYNND